MMDITVEIDYARVKRQLALISSEQTMTELNQHIGNEALDRVKVFLDKMSATRHKTAERLRAPHSKFLEYASGRVAGSPRGQTTVLENVSAKGSTISIKNTPGLSRAHHDLRITPKRARALTIPLDSLSAHKRVRDLERENHKIFRIPKTNVLAESRGKGKNARVRPLYALVGAVTIPQDPGLLPTKEQVTEWATDAAEDFFDAMGVT